MTKVAGGASLTPQRKALRHVYWIGGSPCAGKSSISTRLAARHDLRLYHVDAALPTQLSRLNATDHPALTTWLAASCADRWMQPVEVLVAEVMACYREHFALVLEDLLAIPADRPLLVEGTALLPHLVAPLANPGQAVWVIPTEAFQRDHYARRSFVAAILADCADPGQAFEQWMARDAAFARQVQRQAEEDGFPALIVDGARTIEQGVAQIEAQFGWSR